MAVDGKVFFTNDDGETFVLKAGPTFELLHTNDIGERTLACRLFEMKQDKGKVRMDVKWWASPEIPGGLARLEMVPEGAEKAIITIVAVEWGAAAKK